MTLILFYLVKEQNNDAPQWQRQKWILRKTKAKLIENELEKHYIILSLDVITVLSLISMDGRLMVKAPYNIRNENS